MSEKKPTTYAEYAMIQKIQREHKQRKEAKALRQILLLVATMKKAGGK